MNAINVQTAKTSELLAFYNEHAEKPVNKFTNLETARRRVTALIESLEISNAASADPAPAPAPPKAEKDTKAKPGHEVDKTKVGDKTVPAARRSNAAGIAASWNDPEVRDARLTRQGVVVVFNGKAREFNSTNAAFEALGLPMSKVIRFRMRLKAEGKLTFEYAHKSYEFSIL